MFKNIIANYIGKFWSIISVFIFIPFYIKILGIESYAVINFYTVILTIMYFADAGLSATLNREIARTTDKFYICNMLFTIERIYLFICTFIILFIFIFSDMIGRNWLNSTTISVGDLSLYITLMGCSVAFQLFTTMENSGLLGLEKQVVSNLIQVSSSVFRSAIVLIPLYFYPTLLTFFVWQLIITVLFFFITRYCLWKYVFVEGNYKFDTLILKTVGRFAGGMMLMAIISSLNTQIDKLVISKILSLKEFGYYSLAGVLSQVPYIIISPVATAILPRLVRYSALKSKENLKEFFHQNSYLLSAIATTVGVLLFIFTEDFIFIWTHDLLIAESISNVTRGLIIGSLFLSFQFMPYYLAIANGHTKTNIQLGIGILIVIIPSLIFTVTKFGLMGAAVTWLVMNIFSYLYLGYVLVNKFLIGSLKQWLIFDTLLPLGVGVLFGLLSYFVTVNLAKGYFVLLYSVIIGCVSLLIHLIIFNVLYPNNEIKNYLRNNINSN